MTQKIITDLTQGRRTGFIPEATRSTDIFFGAREVPHTIDAVVPWLVYFSPGETQIGTYYETNGCTTFSALNIVEAILNYLIMHKKISPENIQWLTEKGYIEDGFVNLSDNFTAKMSGTDPAFGNTFGKVWWSIRNHGVVPEKVWSWSRDRDIPEDHKFVEYFYREIPEDVKKLGREFRERFDIYYEQVVMSEEKEVAEALRHSPIHVAISPYCPWNLGVQQQCIDTFSHAVSYAENLSSKEYIALFDHYILQDQPNQFIRKVAPNYLFYYYGYIPTITEKSMDNSFVKILKDKNSSAVGFFIPCTSPDALTTLALAHNKTIHKKSPTEIDWTKTIEGTFELKK